MQTQTASARPPRRSPVIQMENMAGTSPPSQPSGASAIFPSLGWRLARLKEANLIIGAVVELLLRDIVLVGAEHDGSGPRLLASYMQRAAEENYGYAIAVADLATRDSLTSETLTK